MTVSKKVRPSRSEREYAATSPLSRETRDEPASFRNDRYFAPFPPMARERLRNHRAAGFWRLHYHCRMAVFFMQQNKQPAN